LLDCTLVTTVQRKHAGKIQADGSVLDIVARSISKIMILIIEFALVPGGGLATEANGSRKRTGPAFSRALTSRAIDLTMNRVQIATSVSRRKLNGDAMRCSSLQRWGRFFR
jgi:hypothetical protein